MKFGRRGVTPALPAKVAPPAPKPVPPEPPKVDGVPPPELSQTKAPETPQEAQGMAPPTHPEGSGDTQIPLPSAFTDTPPKKAKTYTCEFCKTTGERDPGAYVTAIDRKGATHYICLVCAPRFYFPAKVRGKDSTPGYKVAPVTDSAVVRLVDRHGVLYPVFRGFYPTLLRLVYGVEGCAEPYKDDLLGKYPVRELDLGESAYDWESPIPWPFKWRKRPPVWHPWFRDPGHKEVVTRKAKDKDGEVTEKTEEVFVKGKLRFAVLIKATTQAPVLSLGSYRATIDHAHSHGSLDEMAAMKDLAVERVVKAEGEIKVEASRQALQYINAMLEKEAEEGTSRPSLMGKLSEDVEHLKQLAKEQDDHDNGRGADVE